MNKIRTLIRQTFAEWNEDKAPRLAAAMAYYTIFSLAPLLVIALSVIGVFYDRQAAQERIVQQIGGLTGPQGAELVQTMLESSQDLGENELASIVGFIVLIFGVTGVFGQLQDALNTIWEVVPKPKPGILGVIKARSLSFTMVMGVCFLLLVSLVFSAALTALQDWSVGLFPGLELIMQIVNFMISFLIITLLFALIFKYVPDAYIRWKDVWLGAAITSLLFTIGKTLIGLYLGNINTAASFGAAGSLVILLLWLYYTAQISFLGAEFTQVYANTYGAKIVPHDDAIPLSASSRAQQGIPSKEETHALEEASSAGQTLPHSSEVPFRGASLKNENAGPENRVPRAVATFASILLALGLVVGYRLGNIRLKN